MNPQRELVASARGTAILGVVGKSFGVLFGILVFGGCAPSLEDPGAWPDTPLPNCDGDIDVVADIFGRNCGSESCHEGDNPEADLDLLGGGAFQRMLGASSASCDGRLLIDPNDVSNSFLLDKIRGRAHIPEGCGDQMPFGSRLTANQLGCVERWVREQLDPLSDGGMPDGMLSDGGDFDGGAPDTGIDSGGIDSGADVGSDAGVDPDARPSDAGPDTMGRYVACVGAGEAIREVPWEPAGEAVRVRPGTGINNDATAASNGSTVGQLRFDLTGVPMGTLYFWMRCRAPGPGADSVYVQTDGAFARQSLTEDPAVQWVPLTQSLMSSGGSAAVAFKNREASFEIIEFCASDDPDFDPAL